MQCERDDRGGRRRGNSLVSRDGSGGGSQVSELEIGARCGVTRNLWACCFVAFREVCDLLPSIFR